MCMQEMFIQMASNLFSR